MLPPRRVLAAIDFSAASRTAFGLAARLAQQCDADLHIIHALDPAVAAAASADGTNLAREIRDELPRFLSTDAPLHVHVVNGDAAQVIIDIAQRERIDLVVIGTQGHAPPVGHALGTTAEQVVLRSLTPVLIVPAEWEAASFADGEPSSIGPLLVGVDMTCPSIAAASDACRLAASLKTRVNLIHALPPPQVAPRWQHLAARAAEQQYADSSSDYAHVVQAIQAASPAPTSWTVARGRVVDVLLNACRSEHRALVVIGRGTKPHEYGAPGSVVSRVLALAHVPVLMHVSV